MLSKSIYITSYSSYNGFINTLFRLIVMLMKGSRLPVLNGKVLWIIHRNNVIQTTIYYCCANLILIYTMKKPSLSRSKSHSLGVNGKVNKEKKKKRL